MLTRKVKLNSGYYMPMIGLGTWQSDNEQVLEKALSHAIKVGYRHIDTAHIYGNEKVIGRVLKKIFKSGLIKREDLFITSKIWNKFHHCPEKAIKLSLKDLQLDYLDLYLIHWPVTFEDNDEDGETKSKVTEDDNKDKNKSTIISSFNGVILWKSMESFVEKGWVRSIGYSNFGKINTEKILKDCKIKPAVAQFEIHPYLSQECLVKYYQNKGITVVSYSSLGSSAPNNLKVKEDEEIINLSKKYKKTVSQIILSWLVMRNILVIPKSTNEKHIEENGDLSELEKEDFEKIQGLNKDYRYVNPKEWGPHRFD